MNGILTLLLIFTLDISFADECPPPCLYVTSLTSIVRMPLNATTNTLGKFQVIKSMENTHIRSLDIDAKNERLYWADLVSHELVEYDLKTDTIKKLFTYGIGYPQGIAIDWSSNVLYWVDSLTKVIETATTDGKNRKNLFQLGMDDQPRGIVVHPEKGYIFWTDWGVLSKIERATTAGEDRTTLVSSEIAWPNDLSIDHKNNKLYWIDAKKDVLESIDFDGKNRKIVSKLVYTKDSNVHPYSLAFFSDSVYVTDWNLDSIMTVNTSIAVSAPTEKTFALDSNLKARRNKNIGQVRIDSGPREFTSPCQSNSCSHMCFTLSATQYQCSCPTGMKLMPDKKACQAAEKDYEVFFTDAVLDSPHILHKFSGQEGFTMNRIPVKLDRLSMPVGSAYDEVNKMFYWTDESSNRTYRCRENGSDLKVVIEHKLKASIGLAIDSLSQLMYWFEYQDLNRYNLIVSDMEGGNQKTIYKNLKSPQDVEYFDGYVFVSDIRARKVIRINADGSEPLIADNPMKRVPLKVRGLAIDPIERRIYWCYTSRHLIESADLDFTNRRRIIQKTYYHKGSFYLINDLGYVLDPVDVTIHREQLFWTDAKKRAIFVADKRSGDHVEYLTGGLDEPRSLHVFENKQHTELRKIYSFSFYHDLKDGRYAKCWKDSQCSQHGASAIKNPEPCPKGYVSARTGIQCNNCSDALGANFKCGCTNWMTCAQRAYGKIIGCHPEVPYMEFKVRECIQRVKPGVCPYVAVSCTKSSTDCESDEDCTGELKCCSSSCGNKCISPFKVSNHPCKKNNGGCSHLCMASTSNLRCACPDNMEIGEDGKTCRKIAPKINEVCAQPKHQGSCHPAELKTRFYFDQSTKNCKTFQYGGCGGNGNNFETLTQCRAVCTGSCPASKEISTCEFKNSSCTADNQCKGKSKCCSSGCRKECATPEPIKNAKCFLPTVTGTCKAAIRKYYFDPTTNECKKFTYGGCKGNANRFDDEISCLEACAHVICEEPKAEVGTCEALILRWTFDVKSKKCEQFNYGGCLGNFNNFKTREGCANHCEKSTTTPTTLESTKTITTSTKISEPTIKTKTTLLNTTKKSEATTLKRTNPVTTLKTTSSATKFTTNKPKTTVTESTTKFPTTTKIPSPATKLATLTAITTTKIITTLATEPTTIEESTTEILYTTKTTSTTIKTKGEPTWQPTTTLSVATQNNANITAETLCNEKPCKNGGKCFVVNQKHKCICTNPYYGRDCQFDASRNLISAMFAHKDDNEKFTKSILKTELAFEFTRYCSTVNKNCKFEKPEGKSKSRGRRESDPYMLIHQEWVMVDKFKISKQQVSFSVAIIHPSKGIMAKDTVESGLHYFGAELMGLLGMELIAVGRPTSSQNKAFIIAVILILVVIFAASAVAFYIYRRRQTRQLTANAPTIAFENKLYDDIHPQQVALPDDTPAATGGVNFVNPIFAQPAKADGEEPPPTYEASAAAVVADDVKTKIAKEWVQFEEEDNKEDADLPAKLPIDDFVEAKLNEQQLAPTIEVPLEDFSAKDHTDC